MSKLIKDMDATEKAALLEAIAKILEINKTIGGYKGITSGGVNAAVNILESIK